jgi:translocation and assembly module TamB
LSNKLGLDELGVSYAKGVNNAVLTLGKRLSKQAFLRFEQGVGSASGLVKLRYLFSSRLSVQAQGGSNNAVDAFYSFRFD